MHPKVAVIGGGIGGLGAALSLFRAGFDVHVFEQARALREVGAGIQVSPNASRVLHGFWDLATHWRSSVFDRSHFSSAAGMTAAQW